MKVLLVHNDYQQPGGEDVAFEQERRLLENHGHQVVTYLRSNQELRRYSGLQRITLPKRAIWAGDVYREVLELVRKEKPHIAHVHNTFLQISPSVYAACREGDVPVVQTLHNFRLLCPAATFFREGKVCEDCQVSGLWQGIRHACYKGSYTATATVALMLWVHRMAGTWTNQVTAYVALTEFSKQKFVEAGLPASKIYVKPNFVAPDPGEKKDLGDFAVYVGRLSTEKGLKTLLQAWQRLRTLIPLEIIGDGPLRNELVESASRFNLRNVSFPGRLNTALTRARIKGARLLILPSECYENFPMAVAEAFSCGTPVVCSRLGAMQEIVKDHINGIHFAPANSEELAVRIEGIWSNPQALRALGRAARRDYERKYTAEANYAALMDIYRQVMAGATEEMPPIPVPPATRETPLVEALG